MAVRTNLPKGHKPPSQKKLNYKGGSTITVNQHAVVELAVNGSQDKAEMLLRETSRTMRRIGARTGRKTKGFTVPPKGKGAPANVHDIIRWLDNIDKNSVDLEFLRRLNKTLIGRVSVGFLKSL